jgi:hypothetical protein
MEIHAPDHPITSWKDTAKHLAIITAGVLIALALEGVVAWGDHRLLVREATANLTSEIRANRKELEGMFADIDKELKQLYAADDLAEQVINGTPPKKMEIFLSSNTAELKNAAVTTSQITGAFGFMEYREVRRYADVYDLQAQFMRIQEREGEKFQSVLGFVHRLSSPKLPPAAAIEEWRGQISSLGASLFLREQMARALLKRYDELLNDVSKR